MWFSKRSRLGKFPPAQRSESPDKDVQPEFYPIEFDAMLKGSVVMRRGQPIRQFGVTVDGSTRLVTSGDVVDRPTYLALLAAGAIRPLTGNAPDERPSASADPGFRARFNSLGE